MMSTTDLINNLCELTDRFHQILNTEKLALEAQNFNLLDKTIENKTKLIQEIELAQTELYKLLTSNNLPTTPEGVAILLDQSGDNNLHQRWRGLSDKLIECEQQNRINGALIVSNQNQNAQLLNIITQTENQDIYDSNAQSCQPSKTTTERRA